MTSQPRCIDRIAWRIALCGMALLITAPAWAQSSRIVQVEEHWELKLGQPDSARSAPQTTMVTSPTGDLGCDYFIFTLNHSTVPEYQPGGMQVQHWHESTLVDDQVAEESGALSNTDEVVTWVQKLSLDEGTLTFSIHGGASETWGSFGGDDLTLSTPTELASLNAYRPGTSLTESEVGYADNRVVSLVLTKLVWVTEDGTVQELNSPIPIDTSFNP